VIWLFGSHCFTGATAIALICLRLLCFTLWDGSLFQTVFLNNLISVILADLKHIFDIALFAMHKINGSGFNALS
jgi:uncharacterized membrane protein